jgi:hypothetical protein
MTGESFPHSPLACPRGGYRKNNFEGVVVVVELTKALEALRFFSKVQKLAEQDQQLAAHVSIYLSKKV